MQGRDPIYLNKGAPGGRERLRRRRRHPLRCLSVCLCLGQPVYRFSHAAQQFARLLISGLLFDRQFMVVKESGRFLTQRQFPRLALVEVAIVPAGLLDGSVELGACPDATLVLNAPGMPELKVPLAAPAASKPQTQVTVWEWTGMAADEGDEVAAWWTRYLGLPCRLVRYAGQTGSTTGPAEGDARRRVVDTDWAPPGSGAETAFSDGFPFLLANEKSLEELNSQLAYKGEQELPMNRFRPNFVVRGARAYEEDKWSTVRIGGSSPDGEGGIDFDSVKPCSRCKVTTINQATGEEGLEPLAILREQRSGRVLGWENPPSFRGSVFFCWNLTARQQGVVRVGDRVRATALRPGPPVPNPR